MLGVSFLPLDLSLVASLHSPTGANLLASFQRGEAAFSCVLQSVAHGC